MSWKDILKDMSMLVNIEEMMNKPLPDLKTIQASLINVQRSYPNIFRTNENITDLRGMINQMVDEAEYYHSNTKQLEALRIKEILLSVSNAYARIEELE
tara:strand:- start:16 stop:312 length:297 start_codon:yes stop_codon:yes gene_type:complete